MSRFIYRVFINGNHVGNFTSINHFLNSTINFPVEGVTPLIKAFKHPQFEKQEPKIYVDDSIGLKIESDYLVKTGKL